MFSWHDDALLLANLEAMLISDRLSVSANIGKAILVKLSAKSIIGASLL